MDPCYEDKKQETKLKDQKTSRWRNPYGPYIDRIDKLKIPSFIHFLGNEVKRFRPHQVIFPHSATTSYKKEIWRHEKDEYVFLIIVFFGILVHVAAATVGGVIFHGG